MPANFFPLPSKNPAMHGGPLLLSFGLHSPKAMDYCCESDEDVIINNRFPTFRNEMADCLRTGMLSALHYLDPECRMDMTGLRRIICDNKDTGTSIATAALIFSKLGLAVKAFASSFERIERGPCELAEDVGVIEQRVLTPKEIAATVHHGHIVICAIDPYAVYDHAFSCSHAVLVTGSGDKLLAIHDSMRPPEVPGYHGERNSIRLWEDIEKGRAAHDYHTLVVNGKVPDMDYHRRAIRDALNKGANYSRRLISLQDMAPRPEIPGMEDKIAGVNFTPKLTQVFTNTVPFVCNTGSSSAAAAGLSAMRFYNRTLSLEQSDIEKLLKLKPGQHGAGPIGQLSKVFTKLGYKTKIYRGQQRNLNNNQLRKVLARKQLPICTVDYNKLHKRRKASVQPHTVCITGFDHSQMVLHENGAARLGRPHTPYYMVPTRLFERARIAGEPTLLVKARKIRKAPSLQLGA